jgi:hypothetical protein
MAPANPTRLGSEPVANDTLVTMDVFGYRTGQMFDLFPWGERGISEEREGETSDTYPEPRRDEG